MCAAQRLMAFHCSAHEIERENNLHNLPGHSLDRLLRVREVLDRNSISEATLNHIWRQL
jgi:hypothetical protein